MKIQLCFFNLIFIMTLFANSEPLKPADAKIFSVQLEIIDKSDLPERVIQITDTKTGKKARVHLPINRAGTGHSDQFIIQFFKDDFEKHEFTFNDEKGQALFAHLFQGENKILISNDSEKLSAEVNKLEKSSSTQASVNKKPQTSVLAVPISAEDLNKMKKESDKKIMIAEKTQMQLELEEAQKRAEQIGLQEKMSKDEKRKKLQEARKLVQEADKFFFANKNQEAFEKYSQAVELAPEEESYYYRYAISAYKIGQYNKSLALLSLAEVPLAQATEKTYYQGLNRIKIKDNDKALKDFLEVVEDKDPELSPIASYLAGTIQYQTQKFPEARISMQTVIDTSKDPQLDRSADEMMDLIDRMEQFTESQKEKFRVSFNLGLTYDENVLNLSTANSSTDATAYRLTYGASVLGYLSRTIDSDLALQLGVSDIYSVDTKLKVTGVLQATDPLEYSATLPYSLRFVAFKTNYTLDLTPVVKSLAMNVSGNGRKEILATSGVNLSLSRTLKANLLGAIKLEYLDEKSKLDVTSTADEQSAKKITYGIQTTYLLDLKGEKSLTFELNNLNNNSEGDNYYYDKLSTAVSYNTPWKDRWTGSYRLDYSEQNYSKLSSSRKDKVATLGVSGSKNFNKNQSLNLGINYSSSDSNNTSYDYNKWQVSSVWTYQFSVQRK